LCYACFSPVHVTLREHQKLHRNVVAGLAPAIGQAIILRGFTMLTSMEGQLYDYNISWN
jgi:hypothetical protein